MRILFVCTGNSCRSQTAEALARHLGRGRVRAASAGTEPRPIDPLTFEVLVESGVEVSVLRPKRVEDLPGLDYDWVVTLCGEVEERCPVLAGRRGRLHWPVADPARIPGSLETRREAFRAARDAIRARLEGWLPAAVEQDSG